jgi:sulfate transport system ATP-binding protein
MNIHVRHLTKTFGAFTALDRVSLEIPSGGLTALLGPSGSGKTTLLRIIAGLERPDAGQVEFDGADISGQSARERRVGFVFQHYALFRHLTVFENIAFGLRVRPRRSRPPEAEIRDQVHALLRLIQLESQAHRYPAQLSGGQRQRVALARALAIKPRVLLLDEPFGALDAHVRQELRAWLRELHHAVQVTSVMVTHDQEEALAVADRVAILNAGRLEQVGSPEEVTRRSTNAFVAHFLRDRAGTGAVTIQ